MLGLSTGGLVLGRKSEHENLEHEASVSMPANHGEGNTSGNTTEHGTEDSVAANVVDHQPTNGTDSHRNERETQAEGVVDSLVETRADSAQVQLLVSRWTSVEKQLVELSQRMEILESELTARQAAATEKESSEEQDTYVDPQPIDTPERRRSALIDAGVPPADAKDIAWRQSVLEMEQLEIVREDLAALPVQRHRIGFGSAD